MRFIWNVSIGGNCKHLQECMEDAGHELDDLGPKLGFKRKNVDQNP